ncbi:MAG: signal peptide peptidase SppA [Candidatus Lambdaproteobacteria bacterium]|nr:signal peptide peptidase SppA [Candidatus Lambdaproteobacteria bacterium]
MKALLRIAAALLLAGIVAGLLAACSPLGLSNNLPPFREVLLQGEGDDKFLLIDIDGPISNDPLLVSGLGVLPGMTARVRQELEIAYEDRSIRGILLRINSPGGTITDSDVIYHSLVEFKRSKNIKIVASMGDVAASGGLYVAMAADEIYAHPTTLTGSIGVMLPHIEYAELMDKLGIRSDPVVSGKLKDMETPYRQRTPEEAQILQQIVNQQFEQFVKVILESRRRLTSDQVRAIADGRVMSAQTAKEQGLIDGVGYLDDAYKRLSQVAGFPTNRLVRYANTWRTGSNIYSNTFPIELYNN